MSQSETKTMPEAREFWVECDDNLLLTASYNEPNTKVYQTFHVIEYSAYSALNEQLAATKAECERLQNKIDTSYEEVVENLKETIDDLKALVAENLMLREETSNEAWLNMQNRIVELTGALNKIGMLAMSEHAYTSEFTERVQQIVKEALNEKK